MKTTRPYQRSVIVFHIGLVIILGLAGCLNNAQTRPGVNDLYLLALDSTNLLVTEVARDLDEPWELLWGADDHLWYTAHKGSVYRVNPSNGESQLLLTIPEVHYERSQGLLSMVMHPDFHIEPYLYLHYTYKEGPLDDNIHSRLVRYTYDPDDYVLINPLVILDKIPGYLGHNGSRMIITPDKKIILSTGDVGDEEQSQNPAAISGKMLRLNLDGSVPDDNPIPRSYVYSIGHRNAQGLTVGNHSIYSSEHGPNNDDEINLIRPGQNYGWPNVEGYCDRENEMTFCRNTEVSEPLITWTPTVAPAGLDFYSHPAIPEWENSLILTTLKGRSLRVLKLNTTGEEITREHIYFQRLFGRMRDLCIAPNGDVYISTSNTDWHPRSQGWMYQNLPEEGNDRIIRLTAIADKSSYNELALLEADSAQMPLFNENYEITALDDDAGARLYVLNCAPCHLPGGQGSPGFIPPLQAPDWVGDKEKLITITLQGLSEKIVVNGEKYHDIMPGFAVGLNDQQISDILNFVRKELNDYEGLIEADQVAAVRRKLQL